MIWSSQHELIQEKLGLSNPIAFCSEMTGVVAERKIVDVLYIDFSKAFGTVSHKVLIDTW